MPKSHKPEENPASKLENLIPERIQKILGEPALLPYEDVDRFNELRAEMFSYFNPKDVVESIIVDEIAMKQWEKGQLASIRQTVVELALPAAAVQLIPKELESGLEISHISARDVGPLIRLATSGHVDEREFVERLLRAAGVSTRMLQVQAYSHSLDILTVIEDLRVKIERRLDQLIRTLEDRRRLKAAMLPATDLVRKTSVDAEVKSG